MTINSVYSAYIEIFSFSSREVLGGQSWWQMWSFQQFKCSCTTTLKVWPECFDNHVCIWNEFYSWHLLVLSIRFLLPSMYVLADLPNLQNVVDFGDSVQYIFICVSLHSLVVINLCQIQCWSSPTKILRLGHVKYHTVTLLGKISPVVFECIKPLPSHQREILTSTSTLCSAIGNSSGATWGESAHLDCISFRLTH